MDAQPRIFIVEDEALIAMELRDRLARLGHTVCGVAAHGERALEQIPPSRPDLVLMDVSLAGPIDGIEVARRLRVGSDAPVVFVTAFSDPELLRRAGEVGPFGYIVKPFDERELNATILMALNKHRLETAAREVNQRLEERVRERTAELERANELLRDREQLLSGLNANLVGTAVYRLVFDPAGRMRCTYLSPNAGALIGVPAETFVDNAERIFGMIEPEDLERVQAGLAEALRTGCNECIEARVRHSAGGFRWFQFRSRLVERLSDGSQVRDGVATDVTAAKETEQALRASRDELARLNAGLEAEAQRRAAALVASERRYSDLVENVSDALIRDDVAGRLVYANNRFLEWFGFTGRSINSIVLEDYVAPEYRAGLRDRHDRRVRGERVPDRFEYEGVRADGRRVRLDVCVTPVVEGGRVTGTQSVIRDVTERRLLEQQLNRTHRLEAIGTLAGGVAHDLNNALAPITMSVQMLKQSCPEQGELLTVLESGAARAAGMVRQLLTFARGGEEGARVAVDVGTLLAEVERIVRSTFPKNVLLRATAAVGLPAVVADPTQLHQVLLNLCVNARDAMPEGGVLTLAAGAVELDAAGAAAMGDTDARPGKYLTVRVQDTGTGIAPPALEHIFEPFYTTKGPNEGTGLGLFTSLGIVKKHGGFIRVASAPDHGTTFTVYLPCPAEQPGASQSRPEAPFRGEGRTVLIVDDEKAIRHLAEMILKRAGFTVRTALNGAGALAAVTELGDQLSVMVTDLNMPGMSGVELVRGVRELRPNLPIVVASGLLGAAERTQLGALNVTGTMNKPYTQAHLLQALRAVLEPRPAA